MLVLQMLNLDPLHSQRGIVATGPLACMIRLSFHVKSKQVKISLPYNTSSAAWLHLLWKGYYFFLQWNTSTEQPST